MPGLHHHAPERAHPLRRKRKVYRSTMAALGFELGFPVFSCQDLSSKIPFKLAAHKLDYH